MLTLKGRDFLLTPPREVHLACAAACTGGRVNPNLIPPAPQHRLSNGEVRTKKHEMETNPNQPDYPKAPRASFERPSFLFDT